MFGNYGVLISKEVKEIDGQLKVVRVFHEDTCTEECQAEIEKQNKIIETEQARDSASTIEKAQEEIAIYQAGL